MARLLIHNFLRNPLAYRLRYGMRPRRRIELFLSHGRRAYQCPYTGVAVAMVYSLAVKQSLRYVYAAACISCAVRCLHYI